MPPDIFVFLFYFKQFFVRNAGFFDRVRETVANDPRLNTIVQRVGGFESFILFTLPADNTFNLLQIQVYLFMYWEYVDFLLRDHLNRLTFIVVVLEDVKNLIDAIKIIAVGLERITAQIQASVNTLSRVFTEFTQTFEARIPPEFSNIVNEIRLIRVRIDRLEDDLQTELPLLVAVRVSNAILEVVQLAEQRFSETLQRFRDNLIRELQVTVLGVSEIVEQLIESAISPLRGILETLTETLRDSFQEVLQKLQDLQDSVQIIKETIDRNQMELLRRIQESTQDIYNRIRDLYNQWLEEYWNSFTTEYNTFLEEFRVKTNELIAISTSLVGTTVSIEGIVTIIQSTSSAILASSLESTTVLNGLLVEYGPTWSVTKNNTKQIIEKINNLPEELVKRIEEKLDKLFDKLADEVSLRIVGESHYKYDAISSFYPTLTLIFKEDNVSQYPRRTQIKLRLPVMTDELTDQYIEEIKLKATSLVGLTYSHGAIRATFVSTDKRFRTLVIVDSKKEAQRLFKVLLNFLGEPFEETTLTYSEGYKRPAKTKRTIPLDGVALNKATYNEKFTLKLYRIVLLVNGLTAPIVIYQDK